MRVQNLKIDQRVHSCKSILVRFQLKSYTANMYRNETWLEICDFWA